MKIRLHVILLSVLLSGCDGYLRIKGIAPSDPACTLFVIDKFSGEVANQFQISGPFEEGLMYPGWVSPKFSLRAECGGKVVKYIENPQIHRGETDVGTIEP